MAEGLTTTGSSDLRSPERRSSIVRERVKPGRPEAWFVVVLALIAGIHLAITLWLSASSLTPNEQRAAAGQTGDLMAPYLASEGFRIIAALASAIAVAGIGLAGRRLLHGSIAGLLAASLVALDPAILVVGHLGLSNTIVIALAAWSLFFFLAPITKRHWVGSVLLAIACLLHPIMVLWGIPMAILAMVRGHIYAAPRHLVVALAQGLALPVVAALIGRAMGNYVTCQLPWSLSSMLLVNPLTYGPNVAAPGPITWFAGVGAALALGGAGLYRVGSRFRMARVPGRLQLRLPEALPAMHSRALWLLLLIGFAPMVEIWLLLGAIGLAAGVRLLADDAPGFGLVLGAASILAAVVWLYRAWGLINGSGAELHDVLPWASAVSCR